MQETVSDSGISWDICKSAPRSRQPRQHSTTQFFTGRMPFLPPNQQCQSTEGTASEAHCYIQTSQKPSNSLSSVTKHGAMEIFKNWSELILEQPITRSVGSG